MKTNGPKNTKKKIIKKKSMKTNGQSYALQT